MAIAHRPNRLIGMAYVPGNEGGTSWHRGDCKWFPDRDDTQYEDSKFNYQSQEGLRRLVEEYVMDGWIPVKPLFPKSGELLTLGSCFARELQYAMEDNQKELKHLWVPSGLNNTFAMRQFLYWVATGDTSTDAYWYDAQEQGGAVKWQPSHERVQYYKAFSQVDGFVLTLGLAEIWCDKKTNGVFWRGVPDDVFNPDKHIFRVSTVEENKKNLREIALLLSEHFPHKPVIYTVSPVPLKTTFRNISCLTADCASKSILKAAVDEIIREEIPDVYYWPSFEIIRWLGSHLTRPTFSDNTLDCRHVSEDLVKIIVSTFINYYFEKK